MTAQKRPLTDTDADGGCEELSVRNEALEQEDEPMGEAEQDDEEEEDGAAAGEAGGAEGKSVVLSCRRDSRTTLQADEVEILLVNGYDNINFRQLCLNQTSREEHESPSPVVNPCKAELHLLDKEETLARIIANCKYTTNHVILGYQRRKLPSS